jgi:hypothetical protein
LIFNLKDHSNVLTSPGTTGRIDFFFALRSANNQLIHMNLTRRIGVAFFLATGLLIQAQDWKPAGNNIKTAWAEKVNPANPLPEYPRPLLVREQWQCLNGMWDYAILPKGNAMPGKFEGKILVPFAIESSLSGVQKSVGDQHELWYHRTFAMPVQWKNKRIMLNFGLWTGKPMYG